MSGTTPTAREEALARWLGSAPVPTDERGLERALDEYRRSKAGRRPRRRLIRGVAALSAAGAVMSGGMAAAYAASLPGPVQRVAHRWLSPLGVPAPRHRESVVRRAHREHVVPPTNPTVAAGPLLAAVTGPVVFGDSLDLVATATARDERVVLLRLEHGRWHRQTSAMAPSDLHVVFRIRPQADARYAVAEPALLRRSRPVTVIVQPRLTWTLHRSASSLVVRVRVDGAAAGEQLRLVRATAHELRLVAATRIDARGSALLAITRPATGAEYLIEVRATRTHGGARATLTTATRKPRAS